jgi:O-antigen ligase
VLSQWAFGCFLGIVGFALVVVRILEDETCMTWVPIAIAAAALFLAVRVILWRFDEGLTASASHVRNNAWLGKIQIAWVLNLTAPFLLAGFLRERRVVAAMSYGGAWLLTGGAIYVLFSKAGSFTFALTTVSLCLLNAREWRRWLPPLVGGIGVLVALIAASPAMSTRVVESLLHPDRDAGIAMRQDVWRQTVRMIVDHPVVGIGLGTYDDVAHSRYGPPADPHFFRNGWHAHNMFLHVLAETGAVGFLACGYLGLTIVRLPFRRWRDDAGRGRPDGTAVLGVVLAFVVLSMTEAMLAARVHASLRMNFVLVLLVIYGLRLASRTQSASTRAGGAR